MLLFRDHTDLVRIALVCVCCFATQVAAAGEWRYQAGVSTSWHEVSEHENGNQLVEEQGWMTGLSGVLEHIRGPWRVGIEGEYIDGTLDYDGATQLGLPLQTGTDWQRGSVAMFADRDISSAGGFQLGGGLEYEWRHRDITSTETVPGLEERYQTVWLGLRGRVSPRRSLTAELHAACAVDSTIDVSFDSNLDDASVNVDEYCRVGVSARADIRRLGRAVLFVKPFAAWERYPRTDSSRLASDGVQVGQVHLPETEFLAFGITLGIGHRRD